MENVNLQETKHLEVEIDTKLLKYVYFESSEIESFTKGFTEQLKGVEYLNSNGVGLKNLNGKSLRSLKELLIFWGGSNRIRRLEANAFSGNKKLEAIYLKFNEINFVDPAAFDGLPELYLLDLSSNKLKAVPSAFNSISSLVKLDLSSNLIENINSKAFSKLHELRELNLQKNQLTRLDPELFHPLTDLEFIDISFNQIKFIFGELFQHNFHLKKILFIGNKIQAIEEKFVQHQKPKLFHISFRNNNCVDDDIKSLKNEIEKLRKCFLNFKNNSS